MSSPAPALPLAGKVALVTGSSRSIGASIAARLAFDGAAVVINYTTSAAAADALAASINAAGRGRAVAIQADMSSVAEGRRLVQETVEKLGRLDIVVLNAGYMVNEPLAELQEDEFERHFGMNVKVPLFQVQEAAKHMGPGGRVVFLSSAVTKFSGVGPSSVLYTASKGAVEQLTRVLAKDLGARGMTVNAVAPGATETTLFRKGRTQEFVDFVASLHPLKRIAEPDEIAPIVAFLAGEEAGWVNGQTIFVNGGYAV